MRGVIALPAALALLIAAGYAGAQGAGSTTGEAAPTDLASVKKLEQQLSDAGFNPGLIDGKVDDHTKRAVTEYQQAKGLETTGLLDAETQASLLAEAKGVTKGVSGPGPRPRAGEFRDPAKPKSPDGGSVPGTPGETPPKQP